MSFRVWFPRAAAATVAVITIAAVAAAAWPPSHREPSTEVIQRTPGRVERGKYLVEHVLACFECHGERDWTRYGGPVLRRGVGGMCLGPESGMPGTVCVPNITPDSDTGVGKWSDGELLRAIREGVDRDGKALFPFMPYGQYRSLSDEDARAVVSYLRTLPAVRKAVPRSEIDFPVSLFVKLEPKPIGGPVASPNRTDRRAYGGYLVTLAGCEPCHTPVDAQHHPIAGRAFSGGQEFRGPWGFVRSANLTPHETGTLPAAEALFVARIRQYADVNKTAVPIDAAQNTVMPWLALAGMHEEDLRAVYTFLRTVRPVANRVVPRPSPTMK